MDKLELKKLADRLRNEYSNLYASSKMAEGKAKEIEYLEARRELLNLIDEEIRVKKSIPIDIVRKRVEAKKKPSRIETGITPLDYQLVTEEMYVRNQKGGFSIGNFIQLVGSRGSGKSALLMKLISGFSFYEEVSWFDFEMGEDRVIQKLNEFRSNESNIMHYASSRDLSEIVDEIKFLNAGGIKHFVIDSAMKIEVPGVDRYEKFSTISSRLAELTSNLGINIYLINQLSQGSEKDGVLAIKHGNDAEYDADYIFYLLKLPLMEDGRNVKDEVGGIVYDENVRVLKCTKNRQDDRLFTVNIMKYDIYGSDPEEIVYEME